MTKRKESLSKIRRNIENVYKKRNSLKVYLDHPVTRKWYVWKMDEILPNILEYWCLVRYRTLTGIGLYKLAWKLELRKYIERAMGFTIEEDDSKSARRKAIKQAIEWKEYSSPKRLEYTVYLQFLVEGLDMEIPEYMQAVEECSSHLDDIVELILGRDKDEAMDYVDKL